MSQEEIKKYLLNKRLSGDERFFTIKNITDNITDGKRNVHRNINRLYFYGFLELETSHDRDIKYGNRCRFIRELVLPRAFRISKKVLKENK